jgi:DNA-binding response OmpR family regulator
MKPPRVLIADDDASLCRILEMRMKTIGVQPVVCHDAMHALHVIHRDPPDVVVMDITMPAGNGLAAIEMLASDERLAAIPVVILTGRSDQATRDRIANLGARYVLKSGDLWNRLKPMLTELLGATAA